MQRVESRMPAAASARSSPSTTCPAQSLGAISVPSFPVRILLSR